MSTDSIFKNDGKLRYNLSPIRDSFFPFLWNGPATIKWTINWEEFITKKGRWIMSKKRRVYSSEFKLEAVKLSIESEKTVKEISEELGNSF